jgi:hypothetical protein
MKTSLLICLIVLSVSSVLGNRIDLANKKPAYGRRVFVSNID